MSTSSDSKIRHGLIVVKNQIQPNPSASDPGNVAACAPR